MEEKNVFEGIIGYDAIKAELSQILDMIKNPEIYRALGAQPVHGILLAGAPGLGKSTLAQAFIAASGLKSFTIRRMKGNDDFIDQISSTFEKARDSQAACIVYLDDLDKFSNDDQDHRDSEELVAVQAGIDLVKDSEVYVIATVNEYRKLPSSLTRAGRFDTKIDVLPPTAEDAQKIIEYYLSTKKVSKDLNLADVGKMISYRSCSELETLINLAAVKAAYERKDAIEIKHLVSAVLREEYDAPDEEDGCGEDYGSADEETDTELRNAALHEAGHLVIAEALCKGCVGLASVKGPSRRSSSGGFIHLCREFTRRPYHVLISLGGKAAVELYDSHAVASGTSSDIARATELIRMGLSTTGTRGFALVDMTDRAFCDSSQKFLAGQEAVITAELERFFLHAKNILIKNRVFLEKVADALYRKQTLLWSDIQAIEAEFAPLEKIAV